jgi:hypothetical protein
MHNFIDKDILHKIGLHINDLGTFHNFIVSIKNIGNKEQLILHKKRYFSKTPNPKYYICIINFNVNYSNFDVFLALNYDEKITINFIIEKNKENINICDFEETLYFNRIKKIEEITYDKYNFMKDITKETRINKILHQRIIDTIVNYISVCGKCNDPFSTIINKKLYKEHECGYISCYKCSPTTICKCDKCNIP